MDCPERERLAADVNRVLGRITEIAEQQRAALNVSSASFYCLDRDLELAVGDKERAIGALRQHQKEHGCF